MTDVINHFWQSTLFAAVAHRAAGAQRRSGEDALLAVAGGIGQVPDPVLAACLTGSPGRLAGVAPLGRRMRLSRFRSLRPYSAVYGLRGGGRGVAGGGAAGIWLAAQSCWWRDGCRQVDGDPVGGVTATAVPMDAARGGAVVAHAIEPGVFGMYASGPAVCPRGLPTGSRPRNSTRSWPTKFCHARRRDNLTAAVHMVVEAVFWFHPLVWWIGARLVDERERACDEEVLRAGQHPAGLRRRHPERLQVLSRVAAALRVGSDRRGSQETNRGNHDRIT